MRQRKREGYTLHTDRLGSRDLLPGLAIAGFFEDLVQRTHLPGFFQEQSYGLFQVPKRLLLAAPAGGHVQLQGVGHKAAALFENARGELNLHGLWN
jgi:hypothetical protein